MNKNLNRFLEIFFEISKIPRASGKENIFAEFLTEFAKQHNLEYYKDDYNNVLIRKKGNIKSTIVFQAHIDMVCVKTEESSHNFDTDPIEIIRDADTITAKDTSLGADQGIGLAIMLFLLENKELELPNLECLFTTEEETTFNGAAKFDYSKLIGRKIINLDHCEDDSIVIGCDGDICNKYILTGNLNSSDMKAYKIKISNILGGSSGIEFDRITKSAIMIMAKVLENLKEEILISSINGGNSEGDIATSCECVVKCNIENLEEKVRRLLDTYYSNAILEIKETETKNAFSVCDTRKIIKEILNLKQGILTRKNDEVCTTGSIGVIKTNKNKIEISSVLRSIEKDELLIYNDENDKISQNNGFVKEEIYRDKIWKPNKNSELAKKYRRTYFNIFNRECKEKITHAGLECAVFSDKLENLDIISVGAIIEGFHTVNEKMYISSCEKTLNVIIEFLKEYK